MSNVVERFRFGSVPGIDELLRWRTGSGRDYARLAQFHYLRNKPVTATRVLVLEAPERSMVERWRQMSDVECGMSDVKTSRYTSDMRHPTSHIVAVLVESLPALSCVLRDVATGGRYAGWKDRGMAARLLNSEVRCISRVVVHPQWRGLGLAVKLVRRALQTMTTPYTEALAAMGRVHPFFKLAGMTEYRRPVLPGRQRLIDAMRYCGVEPWELASRERMMRVVGESDQEEKNPGQGAPGMDAVAGLGARVLRRELGRWAGRRLTLEQQLEKASAQLLCEPVYYGMRRD